MTTYTVIVTFSLPAASPVAESERAVEDEITSWLESLNAQVEHVQVRREAATP